MIQKLKDKISDWWFLNRDKLPFYRKTRNAYYWCRKWFKPAHPKVRAAIPRQWSDLTEIIVDVNLAIIADFKEEADNSCVDWDHCEKHRAFKNWLDEAANYANVERPKLLKQQEAAYPPLGNDIFANLNSGKTYAELYGEVDRLEKLIDDTDTKYIKQMLEYRSFFWT